MRTHWSAEEDAALTGLVSTYGRQWGLIASQLQNRSPSQVAARWEKCLDPKLVKGPFTEEEDRVILDYVEKNGAQNWPQLAQLLAQRSPKQLRERWCNHLDPSVSHTPWSPEEDLRVLEHYDLYGPRWSAMARTLPGRTDNSIKNRWHSSISKRIRLNENGNRVLRPERVIARGGRDRRRPPPLGAPGPAPSGGADSWPANLFDDISFLDDKETEHIGDWEERFSARPAPGNSSQTSGTGECFFGDGFDAAVTSGRMFGFGETKW
jgi:hypothetical protein